MVYASPEGIRRTSMKRITGSLLALAVFAPAVASAGQIYGTIVLEGKGVRDLAVQIQCGKEEPVAGTTAADGGYRINVPQQGQCTLALPSYQGRPAATIFSSPNPTAYNFEIVRLGDGKFELKRR
jgi:hypothetical protein